MKNQKELWKRLIASVYVISFICSSIAVCLTVYALSRWPFVHETVESSRQIFRIFGLYFGALIIALMNAVIIFTAPLIILVLLRWLENGNSRIHLIRSLSLSFVDAWGFGNLASGFLDMSTDIFILHAILNNRLPGDPLFSYQLIGYVTQIVMMITFIILFAVRILKEKSNRKPATSNATI